MNPSYLLLAFLLLACGDKEEPVDEPDDDGWGLGDDGGFDGGGTDDGVADGELEGELVFRERDREEGYDCSVVWRAAGVASSHICEYCDFEMDWQFDATYAFSAGRSDADAEDCRGTGAWEYYQEGDYYADNFGQYVAVWAFSSDEWLMDYLVEEYGEVVADAFDGFWVVGGQEDGGLDFYALGPATFDAATGAFSWNQYGLYEIIYGESYYEMYGYEYSFSASATVN